MLDCFRFSFLFCLFVSLACAIPLLGGRRIIDLFRNDRKHDDDDDDDGI